MGFFGWFNDPKRYRARKLLQVMVLMGALLKPTQALAEQSRDGPTTMRAVVESEQRDTDFLRNKLERSVTHSGHFDVKKLAAVRAGLARQEKELKRLRTVNVVWGTGTGIYTGVKAKSNAELTAGMIGQLGNAAYTISIDNRIDLIEDLQSTLTQIYDFEVADEYSQRLLTVPDFRMIKTHVMSLTAKVTSYKWEDIMRKESRNPPLVAAVKELRQALAEEVMYDIQKIDAIVAKNGSPMQAQQWKEIKEANVRLVSPFLQQR